MDLAFDNHRINNIAAIIHRYEAPNLDLSSSFVNIHYANVTAEWVCQVRRIVIRHRFEAGLHSLGVIGISRKSDFLYRLGLRRISPHEELTRLPLEISFARLKQMGGDLLGLLPNFPGGHSGRGPCCGRAATRIGAEPIRGCVRISFLYCNMVHRDP